MKTRWILVCDASRAQLFRESDPGGEYELIEKFDHPDSRARGRDLMADTTGRKPVGPSVGASHGGRSVSLGFGRPGVEPDTDPKEVEAEKFARELGAVLDKGLASRTYEALVLVAPPKFLGLLKQTISREVTKHLEGSVPKDLAQLPAKEVQERVRQDLEPTEPEE
jgi:protein required for attachment to host cells